MTLKEKIFLFFAGVKIFLKESGTIESGFKNCPRCEHRENKELVVYESKKEHYGLNINICKCSNCGTLYKIEKKTYYDPGLSVIFSCEEIK